MIKSDLYIDFNPRSYKRSDDYAITGHSTAKNFNPRSYKRSDSIRSVPFSMFLISIHAPTRGATAKMHNNPYTYL